MKLQRMILFAALMLAFTLGLSQLTRSASAASVLLVNSTTDHDDGSCDASDCTLREAVRFAQGGGGGGIVQFDPVAFPQGGTVTLDPTLKQMFLYYPLTIDGMVTSNGQALGTVTINGNGMNGMFFVNLTQFDVRNVTLTGSAGSAIANGGTLNVTASTFAGNIALAGAAIFNSGTLNVSLSNISDNTASQYGGGIYNTGTLNVTDSIISGNRSERDGGGIYNGIGAANLIRSGVSGNSAASYGGGIFNWSGGSMSIARSTLAGNSAGLGGAIYNVEATVNLNNSIVGNSRSGGGIYSTSGTVDVTNSTIVGNTGTLGGIAYMDGTVTLQNSIVARNTAYNCYPGVTDGGYNLEDSTSCGFSSLNQSQAGIDPLFDPGSLTLQPNSPAVDAANDNVCAAEPVNSSDLLSTARPNGPHCDIGAYEMERGTLVVIKHVVNDNGGTKSASDFTMQVAAANPLSFPGAEAPGTVVGIAPGAFSVTESGNDGYISSVSGCSGSIADNETITCTITNDDIAPPPPTFIFSGFFQPVDNPPTVNVLKGGASVAVKFSLGGNHGLNIWADGYPHSQEMVCVTEAARDAIEELASTETGVLSYDPASDMYTYVWKTKKGWAGTCRQLNLRLSDGSDHIANFRVK